MTTRPPLHADPPGRDVPAHRRRLVRLPQVSKERAATDVKAEAR
jgi:hypothetical protein